jgi:hypothetical protein
MLIRPLALSAADALVLNPTANRKAKIQQTNALAIARPQLIRVFLSYVRAESI